MKEISSSYDPTQHEPIISKSWLDSGIFVADPKSEKEPFTITLPPPNATGHLHLGHSMMIAIQDILIRFKRMQGFEALWVPGTDHAAIATQNRVEQNLREKGMENPRKELGREKLLDEIRDFVEKSKNTIRSQIQAMGASCDWSKESYTFDPEVNKAVFKIFEMMYEDGLIYQGNRIVNWDPKLHTTVSDDEVDRKEENGRFFYLKYGPFVIGTARPETKFGDKYVVMHPDDERYASFKHGDTFELEWINGKVTATVIKDESIDMEFGTGVMTITPWHDMTDFEIAQRHKLSYEQVIDLDGKMLPIAGEFVGMDVKEARKKVIEKLSTKGLVEKIEENYVHAVALNSRGGGQIEPQIMKQWFVDVEKKVMDWKGKKSSVKEVMQDVVSSKMITICPERFEKTYFHWINNLRDWCVSRQIWWGHQIPVWYRVSETEFERVSGKISSSYDLQILNVQVEELRCSDIKPEGGCWIRDPDTLDTWFSSGAWTFTSLGWPHRRDLLEKFHPTDVLETGYDILFFWVARMILMTTYTMRKEGLSEDQSIPFKDVYLHGMVLDKNGKKMSKSHPETCIDPLDMIPKYGADALRLSLVIGGTPGNNIRLYEEKIAGYRNFVNKVWNVGRYILMTVGNGPDHSLQPSSVADKWILSETQKLIKNVTECIEGYRFSEGGEMIYEFLKEEFASWYLEVAKIEKEKDGILRYVFGTILKLLHPYVPYVTEELWKAGEFSEKMLVAEEWPKVLKEYEFEDSNQFDLIKNIITKIRQERAELALNDKEEISVYLEITSDNFFVLESSILIQTFAKIQCVQEKNENMIAVSVRGMKVWLQIKNLIDVEKEKVRLQKELEHTQGQMKSISGKLSNPKFIENADPEVVAVEREKERNFKNRLEVLEERMKMF